MELVELKCPNCGAKLKVDFNGQNIIVCCYCQSTFYIKTGANIELTTEEETVSV